MKTTHQSLYECADLALASVLSLWFPIVSLDKANPHRILFRFEDSQELQHAINEFWNNSLLIEPKSYFQSMKLLKSRMYQD